jgi:hypothetical protein
MLLRSTFDLRKTVKTSTGKILQGLTEKYEVMPFTPDELKAICEKTYVPSEPVIHNPLEFQLQLFNTCDISYPFYDEEDKEFDAFIFLNQGGMSETELMLDAALSGNCPKRVFHTQPVEDKYHKDITDKINASEILERIGIPKPRRYYENFHGKFIAKHRKGSKTQGSSVIQNLVPDKIDEFLIQEIIETPTEHPAFCRIVTDFGKITLAILYSNEEEETIMHMPYKTHAFLSVQGFERNQELTSYSEHMLTAHGIDAKTREIPEDLQAYAQKISDYCATEMGLHSIGIDFMKDKHTKNWLSICDINRSPGRKPFYMLAQLEGKKGYEPEYDYKDPVLWQRKIDAVVNYAQSGFDAYLKALSR